VAPRSTLFLTITGAVGILQGTALKLVPFNPASANVFAVSSDLGIVTMAGFPPWIPGASFRLDGTSVSNSPPVVADVCCFVDGTTDGEFNYAPRADSTLLEPIGSRPLAPPSLYRFRRDWSQPEMQFPLSPDGTYMGVSYSGRSQTFWLTRRTSNGSVIEQWDRGGTLLSTARLPGIVLTGLGIDPKDETLWALRIVTGSAELRLENFSTSGQHLGSLDIARPYNSLLSDESGVEFAWIPSK
jgi:hypothetical protein